MKAIIEKSVIFMDDDERNHNMLTSFNYILQAITKSRTEKGLRLNMSDIDSRYFRWGFGSNHMWVHQKQISTDSSTVDEKERIIIVEF